MAFGVFFPWYGVIGPVHGSDPDDPAWTSALDDLGHLNPDLDPATAQRDLFLLLLDVDDGARIGHQGFGDRPIRMLQIEFRGSELSPDALLEIGIKGRVHAAEEGRGHGGVAELAILDGIHVSGHPAAADQLAMHLGLVPGGMLHGLRVQPDVGDVHSVAGTSHPVSVGFPGDAQIDLLSVEGFLTVGRPDAFGDQVREPELLATAPESGRRIEAHRKFGFFAFSACLRLPMGREQAFRAAFHCHVLQFPDFTLAEAEAGFVFQQERMVLGVPSHAGLGDDRHRGELGVRWQIKEPVQHGPERDIPEVRGRAVIADHTIGEQGEGNRGGAVHQLSTGHAEAAAAIGMVHEGELSGVGFGLFRKRELSRHRAVNFRCTFLVLSSWCFVGRKSANCHQRRTKNE